MANEEKKRSILVRFRNYFIAGVVVLIPIGMTVYLTLFLISISSKILPNFICLSIQSISILDLDS